MKRNWTRTFATIAGFFLCACSAALAASHDAGPTESNMPLPQIFDSGVPHNESAIAAKFYTDAQERLRATVMEPFGTTQSAKDFRRGRAAMLVSQVESIVRDLKIEKDTWIGAKAPAAFKEGKRIAQKQAIEAGIKPKGEIVTGSFSLIDQRAVALVAKDMAANLNKAADSMGDRAERILRGIAQTGLSEDLLRGLTGKVDSSNRANVTARIDARVNELIAQGLIEGAPKQVIKQFAADLSGIYGDTVVIINKNSDPMEFDPADYAERVIRTRTREAMETARHEGLQEMGIDLVSVVGKVSNTFCTGFLGMVFSISGKSDKYPSLDELPGGGPPFHVQCSKSTRPFVEELASSEQLKLSRGVADVHKLIGMDPTQAQRAYKDLQIRAQVEDRYKKSTKAA